MHVDWNIMQWRVQVQVFILTLSPILIITIETLFPAFSKARNTNSKIILAERLPTTANTKYKGLSPLLTGSATARAYLKWRLLLQQTAHAWLFTLTALTTAGQAESRNQEEQMLVSGLNTAVFKRISFLKRPRAPIHLERAWKLVQSKIHDQGERQQTRNDNESHRTQPL